MGQSSSSQVMTLSSRGAALAFFDLDRRFTDMGMMERRLRGVRGDEWKESERMTCLGREGAMEDEPEVPGAGEAAEKDEDEHANPQSHQSEWEVVQHFLVAS